jgi:glutamine amidotransferase
MAASTEEDGGHTGLKILKGKVVKMREMHSHNQWQPFNFKKAMLFDQNYPSASSLTKKRILNGRVFYNHEYGFINEDASAISFPINDSLNKYSAMVIKDSVIGMQFHPEKSQHTGAELIKMIA